MIPQQVIYPPMTTHLMKSNPQKGISVGTGSALHHFSFFQDISEEQPRHVILSATTCHTVGWEYITCRQLTGNERRYCAQEFVCNLIINCVFWGSRPYNACRTPVLLFMTIKWSGTVFALCERNDRRYRGVTIITFSNGSRDIMTIIIFRMNFVYCQYCLDEDPINKIKKNVQSAMCG